MRSIPCSSGPVDPPRPPESDGAGVGITIGVLVGRGVLVGEDGGAADSIGNRVEMVPQAKAGAIANPINKRSQT